MKKRLSRALLSMAATVLAVSSAPGSAWGFAEDVCQIVAPGAPRQGKWVNCFDLHCNDDREFGTFKSLRCTARQFAAAAVTTTELLPVRGRSLVHFDATYVIAQALGMDPVDAYWVAAYSQAADQSSFQAYTRKGEGLPKYTTYAIPGVVRTNMAVGGTFFHFVPPRLQTTIEKKLNINGDAEAPLRHVRSWAFGERDTLCRFGLASEPYTNAPGCFELRDKLAEAIGFKFPATSKDDSWGLLTRLAGGEVQLSEEPLPEPIVPLIRLGVYLHAMADRHSHHACLDESPLNRLPDGRFEVIFGPHCTQTDHVVQHGFETGHKELPPRTSQAIEMTYDDIHAWLEKFPAWRKNKPNPVSREALVADLLDALRPPKADQRIKAMRKLWDAHKLCGLPGDEAKGRTCFPDAVAEQSR